MKLFNWHRHSYRLISAMDETDEIYDSEDVGNVYLMILHGKREPDEVKYSTSVVLQCMECGNFKSEIFYGHHATTLMKQKEILENRVCSSQADSKKAMEFDKKKGLNFFNH